MLHAAWVWPVYEPGSSPGFHASCVPAGLPSQLVSAWGRTRVVGVIVNAVARFSTRGVSSIDPPIISQLCVWLATYITPCI
jgi:hypothetical protein